MRCSSCRATAVRKREAILPSRASLAVLRTATWHFVARGRTAPAFLGAVAPGLGARVGLAQWMGEKLLLLDTAGIPAGYPGRGRLIMPSVGRLHIVRSDVGRDACVERRRVRAGEAAAGSHAARDGPVVDIPAASHRLVTRASASRLDRKLK